MSSNDDQFDWDDYHKDTRVLSLDARGAWWDCLFQMRLSKTRGRLDMPLSGYATLFGTTVQRAKRVLDEIADLGVGDIECNGVTNRNEKVTVINRRMYRAFLDAEANRNRQQSFRDRQKGLERNGNVTETFKTGKNALVVEEGLKPKEEEKQQQKKRNLVASSRIPDPFPLTDEMIAWAKKDLPDLRVDEAHDAFVEYYTNLTTAKAFKVDWMLAWKKGMKLALGWQKKADAEKESRINSGQVGKWDGSEDYVPPPVCSRCGSDVCLGGKKCDELAAKLQERIAA